MQVEKGRFSKKGIAAYYPIDLGLAFSGFEWKFFLSVQWRLGKWKGMV